MQKAMLTLNAGSSSLRFALFRIEGDALGPVSHGEVSGIGTAPRFAAHAATGEVLAEQDWGHGKAAGHAALLGPLLDWVEAHLGEVELAAVGHRVVHGGAAHVRPEPVTDALLESLARLVPLAPLHQPHNLAAIRAVAASRPGLPQVACFDTAFHATVPDIATRLALPPEYAAAGMRRYGFHGLSYEYIAGRLAALSPAAAGRVIAAHLGNGASLCAMRGGRSIDTTMGFSTLDGLVMGTRCGCIDPGAVLHLQLERGMSAAEVSELLYRRSGLLGVSGISSDMRDLLASDDARAAAAVELFVFHVARQAGALASSLGGLDLLVFTAGIGTHAPEIRRAVCRRLEWLGIVLDDAANARGEGRISTAASAVEVRVVATDEEAMIARHTRDVLRLGSARGPG